VIKKVIAPFSADGSSCGLVSYDIALSRGRWLSYYAVELITDRSVNCRSILAGLASNESLEGIELNLSSNALVSAGCQVLESHVANVHCLAALDVSDNG